MDLNKLMQQAQQMQQKMAEAQEKLGELRVTGESGGGKVSVTMTGKGDVLELKVDPSVVDPEDVEMLEDLLLTALQDGQAKVAKATEDSMGGVTGGLGGGLPGMF